LNYSASIKSLISQKLRQIKTEKIGATEKRELLKQEESRKRVMLRGKRNPQKLIKTDLRGKRRQAPNCTACHQQLELRRRKELSISEEQRKSGDLNLSREQR
jgi:23S rRNA pseudoU1915 N3-methylase RlmH